MKELKAIFTGFWIPEVLVIDNGPQYNSAELSAFARSWCFEKVTSSPKLPKVFREYPALLEWAERQRRDSGLFLRNGLWDVAAKLCDQPETRF